MNAQVRIEDQFDFRTPDYLAVYRARTERLLRLRSNPQMLRHAKVYYRDHIAQFITDWGITFDPRNLERGLLTTVPFILFPRQAEWVDWIIANWKGQLPGITEKTRQMGFSWLSMALSCALCLFYDGMVIGVGSRKQEYVDVLGDPKSLIQKARMFMEALPKEFRGGWTHSDAPHMRVKFPDSGSIIVGESGDEIGRGNSTAIYFVDEAAYLERPLRVDAALSQTTNCRQDISTPNGMANPFAQKRHSMPADRVFTFHWRDDPRKDDAWYEKQCRELDPVVVASEIDINYAASVEGVVIPSVWVQAAIGAHLKLGLTPTGRRYAGLDVADEGADKNALAVRHGFLLNFLSSWSGKGGDIYQSVVRAFDLCEGLGVEQFDYDADGLGAGVRGDARVINDARRLAGKSQIRDEPWRGSGAVWDPEGEMVQKRKNKDYFANAKAQAYWALRLRFQATYRAVIEGLPYKADELICIDPALAELTALTMELSQATYSINTVGKILVDKMPDGMRSPNLADAVMIAYQPGTRSLDLWLKLAGR